MEGITRHIEEDMGDIIDDEDKYVNLCIIGIVWGRDGGEYSILPDALDGWDTRECRSGRWCLDDDLFLSCQIFSPFDIPKDGMERIEVDNRLFRKGEVDSIRETRGDQEFIHILQSSTRLHESIECTDVTHSDFLTFSLHEGFEAWLAGEEKIEW